VTWTKRKQAGLVASAICGLLLAFVGLPLAWPKIAHIAELSPSREAELRVQGTRIVRNIEQFRAERGHYPATLAETRISPEPTRYGAWSYVLHNKGEFELRVGDYGKHYFTLSWNSRKREWWLDR
jgi:hypothetical protein